MTDTAVRTAPRNSTDPTLMLALATVGFAVTFWAWALLGPLGSSLREQLGLSSFQQSVLVAVPVIVGSLGRIPIGAMTDRFGGRVMFSVMALVTIVPVLYLGHVADSFASYIVGGFFLGVGGTTFAIGIPFVNSWFPPERRGTALGLFGIGMGGTAISAFTTVQLSHKFGPSFPFDLVAVLLLVYAAVAWLLLRDRPDRPKAPGTMVSRTVSVLKLPSTLLLSLLYAVSFGGFVAFSVYLPTYLKNAYHLTASDAATRTAGFVVLAVLMRPVGGWLSDRLHPIPVLTTSYVGAAVLALVAALELTLIPWGTIPFLGLAAMLGLGTGAVFACVPLLAPKEKVGSVTGVVGAAGGLGGFFPPLVMGAVYGIAGDYSLGFVLLAAAALVALACTLLVVRRQIESHSAGQPVASVAGA